MQTRVTFPIREGEDRLAANCQLLGTLDIDGIPPRPAGQERVQVKFIVDERGMLHVEAQSISTRIQQRVTIAGSATLSPQQLKQITTLFH
jgi:molecular chaperone DnaK (HSP70)